MKTTVVLIGSRNPKNRAWPCASEEDAKKMREWLSDNGIDAVAVSPSELAADIAEYEQDFGNAASTD